MKLTEVNGLQYAYDIFQRSSDLPDLLILHGFMGDHRGFDHLTESVSSFCNPIVVDLLGHGNSATPGDPKRYDEKQQVNDIAALISELSSTSSLWLFGYSMGGRLALKIALTHPGLLNGLVLESTNCGIPDANKREKRRKVDAERGQQIQDNLEEFLDKWKKLELFQSPLPVNESLVSNYHHIQSEQSPPALAASLGGFGSGAMTPICDELDQLNLPTLLLAGSADEKYQQINTAMAKALPNAKFSSVRAGHRIHLDHPKALVAEVEQFIKSRAKQH